MKNIPSFFKEFKIVGKTRHFPAAIKEWKDSVYTYDKDYLRSLPIKHSMANKLTKNHFYIHDQSDIARSHRMRSLIIKSSSNKLFISKAEIKHNLDKTMLTVYSYDREKLSFTNNLWFFNKKLYFYLLWLIHNKNKKIKSRELWCLDSDERKLSSFKKQRRIFNKNRKVNNKSLSCFGNKFFNEMDFLRFRTKDIYKDFLSIDYGLSNLFFFYILSFLKIKMIQPSDFFKLYIKRQIIKRKMDNLLYEQKNNSDDKDQEYSLMFNKRLRFLKKENYLVRIKLIRLFNNILQKKPNILLWLDIKSNKLQLVKKSNITKQLLYNIASESIFYNRKSFYNKQLLNYSVWKFIENNIIENNIITRNEMVDLYNNFKSNRYQFIISKLYKDKSKPLYEYAKLELNNLKHNKLLSGLKMLMNNIYNKKIELNIVKLKYINLNSDVYTQAIVAKMKKKVNMLKVLRKSLRLIKLPYINLRNKHISNNTDQLNIHRCLNMNKLFTQFFGKEFIKTSKDLLTAFVDRIYPKNLIHNSDGKAANNTNTKIITILNTVKYKWISGVRLEAAGRLTRRNTASRSAFKIRYKGSLKNKDHHVELDKIKSISTVMLRNQVKANSQYTYMSSTRRIGSFGIKSWINSY